MNVVTASKQLGLKKVTAVSIIKAYKKTGNIPLRNFKRKPQSSRKAEKKIEAIEGLCLENSAVNNDQILENVMPCE